MIRIGLASALTGIAFGGGTPAAVSIASPPLARTVAVDGGEVQVTVRELRGGLAVVTDRLVPRGAVPRTVTLQLYDGDQAVLALPGHADTRFHFRRAGDRIATRIDG